jgi:hypothetical protein
MDFYTETLPTSIAYLMSNCVRSSLVTPVILCGGSGARLWTLSRSGFPKQFLVLSGCEFIWQALGNFKYYRATVCFSVIFPLFTTIFLETLWVGIVIPVITRLSRIYKKRKYYE